MTESLLVEFSFTIDDPNMEEERKQKMATQLLKQLRQWDEVETVVKIDKIGGFLQQLPEIMNKKPIKIIVKVRDNETTIEVKNTEDLPQVEETTKRLIEALQNNN